MSTLKAGLMAALLLVVAACSDLTVPPTAPNDALAARGGLPGPNRPYIVFEDEYGDPLTECGDYGGDCTFVIANVERNATVTATLEFYGTRLIECFAPEEWDGGSGELLPSTWTFTHTVGPIQAGADRTVTGFIPGSSPEFDLPECPPERPLRDFYRYYGLTSKLTVVVEHRVENARVPAYTLTHTFYHEHY